MMVLCLIELPLERLHTIPIFPLKILEKVQNKTVIQWRALRKVISF